MNTNFEKEAIEDLKRRKENFRAFTRNLSPTEKIRQLELLQKRYYEHTGVQTLARRLTERAVAEI